MAEKKLKKKKINIRRHINLVFFFALAIILSCLFFVLVLKPLVNSFFKFDSFLYSESKVEKLINRQFNSQPFEQQYFASFYDNFYNLSSVEKYSNLYYDSTFSSFSSIPLYEFNKNEESLRDLNTISDNYEKVCINNNCLERKEKKLYFNGNLIYLPEFSGVIEFISIDSLDDNFYVSFTIFKDDKYKVRFFIYDKYFKEVVKDLEIVSESLAPVGIGGSSDDFLIFYGSSLGPLYRVKDNKYFDSSNILSRRISNSYFRPEIIKVENIDGQSDFYVYSIFGNGPIFLKMWDNVGEDSLISGVIDLYKLLNLSGEKIIIIDGQKRNTYNEIKLKTEGDNYYSFIDKGFKNDLNGEIISSQVNNKERIKFNISSIEKLDIEFDKESLNKNYNLKIKEIIDMIEEGEGFNSISYSDDLESVLWAKVDINNPLDSFSANDIENIRLKLEFPTYNNSFSSPFLNSWTFNYYYTK